MKLSKLKIIFFFFLIMGIGLYLYPRDLFTAYIYEGTADLKQAEAYYLTYLQKNPNNKFAILRLKNVYENMGDPWRATPYLDKLYHHRIYDWNLAQIYMDHLENLHDEEALYHLELEVADNFIKQKYFPHKKVQALLDKTLEYSQWSQRKEDTYKILNELISLTDKPGKYIEVMDNLDRAYKNIPKVFASIKKRLQEKPKNTDIMKELISAYLSIGDIKKAKEVIDQGVIIAPKDTELLKGRIYLSEEMHLYAECIGDIEKLLGMKVMNVADVELYKEQLAFLYYESKERDVALKLYQEILKDNPANKDNWLNVIYVYSDLERTDDAILLLNDYVKHFPDDLVQRKYLVDLYLYDKRDKTKLDFYRDYLKRDSKMDLALDVAYLLLDNKKVLPKNKIKKPKSKFQTFLDWFRIPEAFAKTNPALYNIDADLSLARFHSHKEALQWLRSIYPQFSNNPKVVELYLQTLMEEKQYAEALTVGLNWLKRVFNDGPVLQQVAETYARLGKKQESVDSYERLANLKKDDFKTQLEVGQEIYFLGRSPLALKYLHRAKELDAKRPEAGYWLSEIYYSQARKHLFKKYAKGSLAQIPQDRSLTKDEIRMQLRMQSHLKFDATAIKKYQSAIAADPANRDLSFDYLDALLDKNKTKLAADELDRCQKKFPKDKESIKPYQASLAVAQRNWDEADTILTQLVNDHPDTLYARKDLAYVETHDGQWRRALDQYNIIQNAVGEELDVSLPLQDWHDRFDHQVITGFKYAKFGSDKIEQGTVGYEGFLNQDWQLSGGFSFGNFDAASVNAQTDAGKGIISITNYIWPDWAISGGFGWGKSNDRNSPTALLGAIYNPFEQLKLSLALNYRMLRDDIPQAVTSGTLEDFGRFDWQYYPIERLLFAGKYEISRSYLPDGAQSIGHSIEPELSYVVFKKPYVTLGYQYAFNNNSSEDGFLNEVSLIPESSAHYIKGFMSYEFIKQAVLELGAFGGEDTKRNLHLFQGDLYGINSCLKARITKWLSANAAYDYGNETLANIPGTNHQFVFSLTGHWK